MQDFEKLGLFYLGKAYDVGHRQVTPDLLLYESKDLTTHAVVRGDDRQRQDGVGDRLAGRGGDRRHPGDRDRPQGRPGQPAAHVPRAASRGLPAVGRPGRGVATGADARAIRREDGRAMARGAGRLGRGRRADRAVPRRRRPLDLHAGEQCRAAADGAPIVRRTAAGPGGTGRGLSRADRLGRLGTAGARGHRRRPDLQPRAYPALEHPRPRLARGAQPGHGRH